MLRIYIYIYIGQQTKERKRGEQRCITLHSVIRHSILDSQLHTYNAFWITVERDSEPSPWPNGLTVNYRKNTKVVWKIWRRKRKENKPKPLPVTDAMGEPKCASIEKWKWNSCLHAKYWSGRMPGTLPLDQVSSPRLRGSYLPLSAFLSSCCYFLCFFLSMLFVLLWHCMCILCVPEPA